MTSCESINEATYADRFTSDRNRVVAQLLWLSGEPVRRAQSQKNPHDVHVRISWHVVSPLASQNLEVGTALTAPPAQDASHQLLRGRARTPQQVQIGDSSLRRSSKRCRLV